MRLIFQRIFSNDNVTFNREEKLVEWYNWAIRSRIEAIVNFAQTLKKHWKGITRWFYSRITNGILEGLNSLVQMAKSRARGFRSVEYFKLIIIGLQGLLLLTHVKTAKSHIFIIYISFLSCKLQHCCIIIFYIFCINV